jgi:hypothetical protein
MRVFMPTIPVMGSALLYRRNSEQGTLQAVQRQVPAQHVGHPLEELGTLDMLFDTPARRAPGTKRNWRK